MASVTLVLLPGMDGTGQLFEPFISALAGEFEIKVVAYPTSTPLNYAELEAIAREVIPKDGPYVILGESFSGPVAISLAASAPTQLKGLILCCTFVRNPRPALSVFGPLLRFLPFGSVPASAGAHLLFGRFSTAELRAALTRSLASVSPSVLRARLSAVLAVDASAKLAGVRVPLLYLRAAHDRLVPSSASASVAHLSPQAQLVEIEAPHCLLQAAPAEAGRAVATFLRQVQNAI
jgi:pimeloyl-ACP methyl ester carboxylesterase